MEVSKYKQMMSHLTRPKNKLQPIAFESGDRATEGVRYTAAEAKALKKEFENFPGLTLTKDGKSYYVTYRRIKAGKKIASYVDLPATEDNIEKLKKVHEITMEKFYPKILTNAEFEKLRLLDENINLTNDEFAKKLTEVYDKTTVQGKEWNGSRVRGIQRSLKIDKDLRPDILKGGPGQGRSVNEAKAIVRAKNKFELDELNLIKDPEERKRAIQKKASTIVAAENATKTKGSLHGVQQSTAGDLWKNFYESAKKNDRIKISGTFDGKDLRFSKNFPRNKDGKVNWFIKDKNGIPAWKQIEFTDTATPKGSVTFKWDLGERTGNLQAQVDNAFGAGHFARSTSAYQRQRQLRKTPFTLDGVEGTNFGNMVARNTIINKYKANNNGRMPSENYIQNRIPQYGPSQVHHFRGGVGNDPYSTQLVSRIANKQLGAAESRHSKAIAAAKGDAEKIKAADNVLIGKIDEISNQYGGIKYEFGGKKFGSAASTKSIMETAVKGIGADEQTTKRLLATISTLPQCQGKFFEGGTPQSLDVCARDGARVINENKINDLSPAQRRNAENFLNRAYKFGRGVAKFGVVPEAIFVAGESLLRIGMGDTLDEAFKRATDYLRTGDQTLEADASKISRTLFDQDAGDLFKSVSNFRKTKKNLEGAQVNLQADLAQNIPEFSGMSDEDIKKIGEDRIKKAKNDFFNAQIAKEQQVLSDYQFEQGQDISKAQSFFTAQKLKGKQMGMMEDDPLQIDLSLTPEQKQSPFIDVRSILTQTPETIQEEINKAYQSGAYGQPGLEDSFEKAKEDYSKTLNTFFNIKNAPLSSLAASPVVGIEQVYGPNPENFLQKRLPAGASFDQRLAYDFAGGGIAKLAGVDSGPPPEKGPTPQGLDFLLKRGR